MTVVCGIILLNKPAGISSARAVARIRRCFNGARTGHGGCLDPLATGALPVYLGWATRFADYSLTATKSYHASICLGLRTDTNDSQGQVIGTRARYRPSLDEVDRAAACFRGVITQTPPSFSAIKIDGERSWRLARAGKNPVPAARTVEVTRLEILEYRYSLLKIYVQCSKGTYIRAIARDLGEKLGVGGTIVSLRRSRIGGFDCGKMCTLDELEACSGDMDRLSSFVLPADTGLGHLGAVILDDERIRHLYHGLAIVLNLAEDAAPDTAQMEGDQPQRIYDRQGRFYGLLRQTEQDLARSVRLIPL
ncbi:MAG: tRNA pseudouridine(55) synthase TruB [Gammaproteobacteria bacterium]|nr:tRNA pseudouridine(55) synthase TruB [Pseudomonadota bacterium]MCH9662903.1 tRNA pseudouridine(55) synthase TruB [Gammaproteobacteria bacterium]